MAVSVPNKERFLISELIPLCMEHFGLSYSAAKNRIYRRTQDGRIPTTERVLGSRWVLREDVKRLLDGELPYD